VSSFREQLWDDRTEVQALRAKLSKVAWLAGKHEAIAARSGNEELEALVHELVNLLDCP
jgi:hypothetical protein